MTSKSAKSARLSGARMPRSVRPSARATAPRRSPREPYPARPLHSTRSARPASGSTARMLRGATARMCSLRTITAPSSARFPRLPARHGQDPDVLPKAKRCVFVRHSSGLYGSACLPANRDSLCCVSGRSGVVTRKPMGVCPGCVTQELRLVVGSLGWRTGNSSP